jgi:hypothetical protein
MRTLLAVAAFFSTHRRSLRSVNIFEDRRSR